jgi:hypothetical protein
VAGLFLGGIGKCPEQLLVSWVVVGFGDDSIQPR